MSQNLVRTHYTAAQWERVDRALEELEAALASQLLALSPAQRQRLVRMGDKSIAFCMKAADVMAECRALLPPSMDVEELHRDLITHAALRERQLRMISLMDRVRDTQIAVGSDAMSCATRGYSVLRRTGDGAGFDQLQRELGRRFANNGPRRRKKTEPAG
jgi:hypothetical protein